MPDNPWIVLGLFVFAIAVTPLAAWLAARWRPSKNRQPEGARFLKDLWSLAAGLTWVLIVFVAGLIAARYIERIPYAVAGLGLFGLVAFLGSMVHARLYQRLRAAQGRPAAPRRAKVPAQRSGIVHYIVFIAAVLFVLLLAAIPVAASDVFRRPYSPVWRTINRTLDRLKYTYNPSGGGQTPEFPPWLTPGDAGLDYRDVTLTTADGLHLAAWYVPASKPGAPTVLLAHGLQDYKWTLLRLIPWLHEAGYNVMALDLRGHGNSDKRPTTLGREEVLDVQSALDWLEAEGAGDRVAALGQSLGAAALVNTAAIDDRLDALILDSLFAEWKNVDYGRGYRLSPRWLVPGVPNPVDVIRRVHVPVFIIHGSADILVHVDHAQRLYDAANEPKFLWINDSGHAWSAWTYPELYQQKVLEFLEDALATPGD
jgi:pimeloyl-ACP methyl ester carboxylesterase